MTSGSRTGQLISINRWLLWSTTYVLGVRICNHVWRKIIIGRLKLDMFGCTWNLFPFLFFLLCSTTAGDDNLSNRIQDYAKIIRSLDLPIKVPATRKYNVDKGQSLYMCVLMRSSSLYHFVWQKVWIFKSGDILWMCLATTELIDPISEIELISGIVFL